MPVGGFDSAKLFEALRSRPWIEDFDSPLLRLSSEFPVLALGGLLGNGGSLNEGNGSGASFGIGAAEAPVTAGGEVDIL
jgi:hypothetical protein